jgi:hypothetical protein
MPFDGAGKYPGNLDARAGQHVIIAEEPYAVGSILGLDFWGGVKSGLFEA